MGHSMLHLWTHHTDVSPFVTWAAEPRAMDMCIQSLPPTAEPLGAAADRMQVDPPPVSANTSCSGLGQAQPGIRAASMSAAVCTPAASSSGANLTQPCSSVPESTVSTSRVYFTCGSLSSAHFDGCEPAPQEGDDESAWVAICIQPLIVVDRLACAMTVCGVQGGGCLHCSEGSPLYPLPL